MSAPFVVSSLDEIRTLTSGDPAEPDWKPVRHHLGVGAFGVNAWVGARAGDLVIERHDEEPAQEGTPGHEELYVVVRGAARFVLDGREVDAPAGTLVFVPERSVTREATATEPDTVVLALGAAPGVAFEPSPWELRSLRERGAA
jgi:AraC-like protein